MPVSMHNDTAAQGRFETLKDLYEQYLQIKKFEDYQAACPSGKTYPNADMEDAKTLGGVLLMATTLGLALYATQDTSMHSIASITAAVGSMYAIHKSNPPQKPAGSTTCEDAKDAFEAKKKEYIELHAREIISAYSPLRVKNLPELVFACLTAPDQLNTDFIGSLKQVDADENGIASKEHTLDTMLMRILEHTSGR